MFIASSRCTCNSGLLVEVKSRSFEGSLQGSMLAKRVYFSNTFGHGEGSYSLHCRGAWKAFSSSGVGFTTERNVCTGNPEPTESIALIEQKHLTSMTSLMNCTAYLEDSTCKLSSGKRSASPAT